MNSVKDIKYVLITPARNEDEYIGKTIEAVIAQTIKPEKWVIISDGSTDKTDEIAESYAKKIDFICFVKTKDQPDRNFGSKVAAFNLGLEQLTNVEYDFIGNLDADISFDPDYYEKVLQRFQQNEKLGIAGGVRVDIVNGKPLKIRSSKNSVAGGFQFFRKKCFEDIGGYKKLDYGGIDAVAEISARMHGWQVESFSDIVAEHNKPTGSAVGNILKQKFRAGVKYYLLGYPPLFPFMRFGLRLKQKPVIIGSLISILGYYWALVFRYKRPVPADFVRYLRKEQKKRIRNMLAGKKDPAFRT